MAEEIALITGGTKGIGKQIAIILAKAGYDIAINYRSQSPEVEQTKQEIEKEGRKVLLVKADVSKSEECKCMCEQIINKWGKIDILVNNAGITKDGLLIRMKDDDFESVIRTNLIGTYNVSKGVVPYMIRQKKGKIINISSVVGVSGNAGQCNYAASKAGIIGFTKSLAKEVASRGILVNAVAPGFIKTSMTEVLSETVKENIKNQIPLKRMGTAEEVAKVVKFLASEDSSYITGQVILVDGGMCI